MPAVLEFNKTIPNTTFAVDASFEPVLRTFGVDQIVKIDTRNKHKHLKLREDRIKARITSLLGYGLNAFKDSLKGEALVNEMVRSYNNGQNLFIFPACVSGPNAEWKMFTGYLAIKIPNAQLGFLYIPDSYKGEMKLKKGPVIGSLISTYKAFTAEELTLAIRSQYLQNK